MHLGLPNVVPVIKQDTIISKTHIEECDSRQIILTPYDTSGRDYVWNNGITDINQPVMQVGTYWVSYSTPCEYHTDTFEVFMLPPSYYSFTDVVCLNEQYDFNGRLLSEPGTYHDTLVAANGCDSIVTLNLVTLPLPEISISVEQETSLCIGDTVLCVANGAKSYKWYINDHFLGDNNRVYIYLSDLSNRVLIAGQADNGCRDTTAVVIQADACCELFVPNAFSPNGDGVNDGFSPVPHGNIQGYRLQLFNRWGQLVFSALDVNDHWDGTYNGMPADAGVYFYYITAKCMEGTELIRKGDVTLIR
jgi:gliding motility-associated-like protein